MPATALPAVVQSPRLMIVDDDHLSREVLGLLAEAAGFKVECHESGEAALAALHAPGAILPDTVLTDMQMPGVSGDALARLLRTVCGAGTRLFAISGSGVAADKTGAFDGFLLKPFSIKDLCAALDRADARRQDPPEPEPDQAAALSPAIYSSFLRTLPSAQVRQLYVLCIDDAEARIHGMRKIQADADAFRRAAHSIKGGCGMVGALELARLAGAMEEDGPAAGDASVTLDEFLAASARLRRILDAQLK